MLRKMLLTLVAFAAVCTVAPAALAGTGPSPTLDGQRLASGSAADASSRCSTGFSTAAISFDVAGTATGSYAGTFVGTGTASLSGWGALSLTELDATFAITSTLGTVKGVMQRVAGRSSGSGTCDGAKQDSTIDAAGIVYTATLPDGTIDQGVVDLSFSDVPATAGYTATFRSTSRIADADLDGVLDGVDNCATFPNADQLDRDADGIGDACDLIDDRPALFDQLVASSKAAAVPKAVLTRAERARTAYLRGDVPAACGELAAYIDAVASRRGKTIQPAVADELVAEAEHIRAVVACR
jgi:hypothetical protein